MVFLFLLFLPCFSSSVVRTRLPFCHPCLQQMYWIVLCLVFFFACAPLRVLFNFGVVHTSYATQSYRPALGTISACGVVQYILCTLFLDFSLLKTVINSVLYIMSKTKSYRRKIYIATAVDFSGYFM